MNDSRTFPGLFLVAALLLILVGFSAGWTLHPSCAVKAAKAETAAVVTTVKIERKSADLGQAAAKKSETAEAKTRVVYQTIKERIPIYVPQSDSRYVISNGFVHVWNAASDGDLSRLSGAPGKSEAEPSAVQPSAVLAGHASDVEYCRVEIGKYSNLFDLMQAQHDVSAKEYSK